MASHSVQRVTDDTHADGQTDHATVTSVAVGLKGT